MSAKTPGQVFRDALHERWTARGHCIDTRPWEMLPEIDRADLDAAAQAAIDAVAPRLAAALTGRHILVDDKDLFLRVDEHMWQVVPARPADLAVQLLAAIGMTAPAADTPDTIRILTRVMVGLSRTMEAARIEMIQNGPAAAMQWILNGLPDHDDNGEHAWDGKESAEAWLDRVDAADDAPAIATVGTEHLAAQLRDRQEG